jgi:hypothetical protein
LPADLVQSIRFHAQDEAARSQWLSIAAEDEVTDVLVVRKSDPAAAERIVLDQLPGVVHEVYEQELEFEIDGEKLKVSRARVEGILFRSRAAEKLVDPVCRVRDADGGVWNVKSMRLAQHDLSLETVAGAQLTIPVQRLTEIDFSAANLTYLADLEAESVEWRPYFQSPATPSSLARWFEPKGIPLILNGQSYEKGLSLHSRTLVSYRLARNYRQLVATIGVDEQFRGTANMQLVIIGDERQLLSRAVKGSDEPFDIALNVDGVRRLKILVDFGDDRSDAGDLLYLCDARLVK